MTEKKKKKKQKKKKKKKTTKTIDGTGREQENVTGHSSETGVMNAQAKSSADSLILVCNLKEKRLDKMLFELRHAEVKVMYKAILTPSNQNWTVPMLMQELRRERFAMMRK